MLWWTVRKLDSKDGRARADAARKLGTAKYEPAIPRLIELLPDISWVGDVDGDVGRVAASALAAIGAPAVDPLIKVLTKGSGRSAANAATALGSIGDSRAVQPLLDVVSRTSDSAVAPAAFESLGNLGDPRAVETLLSAIKTKRSFGGLDGATMAVKALGSGKFRGPVVVNALLDVIRKRHADSTGFLYSSAVEGLGRIGDPACIEPLLDILSRDSPLSIWEGATDVIASFGARSLQPVIARVDSTQRNASYLATKALRKLRHQDSFDVFARLVRVGTADVQEEALNGLAELKNAKAFDVIVELVHSEHPRIGPAAIKALAATGDDRALPILEKILNDKGRPDDIRDAAAAAISEMTGALIWRSRNA